MALPAHAKLQNSLIDCLVVVGFDHNTGLVPCEDQPNSSSDSNATLLATTFEPQILAAISAHEAFYPQSRILSDDSYPPKQSGLKNSEIDSDEKEHQKRSDCQNLSRYGRLSSALLDKFGGRKGSSPITGRKGSSPTGQVTETNAVETNPTPIRRTNSRRTSFRVSLSSGRRRKISVGKKEDKGSPKFPLSSEALHSLATFCFPDGAYVEMEISADRVHFLVLTNAIGKRFYATCITTYKPTIIEKRDSEGDWMCIQLPPTILEPLPRTGQALCYVPCCYVVVSKWPFFTVMKECLSRLLLKLKQDTSNLRQSLKEFTLQLTLTPVAPSGKLLVQVPFQTDCVMVLPPHHPFRPLVDIALNLVFYCLSVDNILKVITCLLTQQKVVFTSSSYALLTIVMESFLHFIYPFVWPFPYVPVLAWRVLELLEAPGNLLMGCHSRHRPLVEKLEEIVLVDLDDGCVRVSNTITLPSMPHRAAAIFKETCQSMQHKFELIQLERPAPLTYEDSKKVELHNREEFNRSVLSACLELMVNLFRHVLFFIKAEGRFFNKEQFLQTRRNEDKGFYEKVTSLEIFREFLKDRIENKKDCWGDFEEKTHIQGKSGRNLGSDIFPACLTKSLSSNSNTSLSMHDVDDMVFLRLPNFLYGFSHDYMNQCSQVTTQALNACVGSYERAPLLYMRGMLRTALRCPVDALEDFHNLNAHDTRLYPIQEVSQIFADMNEEEKALLKQKHFYRLSGNSLQFHERSMATRDDPVVMEIDHFPDVPVGVDRFCSIVQALDIDTHQETCRTLFQVLTMNKDQLLEPSVFEEFYNWWKESEVQNGKVDIHGLEDDETVLVLSDMIKTSLGTGRVGLTEERLFFLYGGSGQFREITSLKSMRLIEITRQKSRFFSSPVIRICYHVDNIERNFLATLREEQQLWYALLREAMAGNAIADELKDPSLVTRTAKNVSLCYAAFRTLSGLENTAEAIQWSNFLCYFTKKRDSPEYQLNEDTREVLLRQLDPSHNEPYKDAVEALLFTATTLKLWCGMGNGKVKVFNTTTWQFESQALQAGQAVVCLLAVGESQVWAGSYDTQIYVIDAHTNTCNRTLVGHVDLITDLCLSQDAKCVFSSGVNGQIIEWEVKNLLRHRDFLLHHTKSLRKIIYSSNNLWCACKEGVYRVRLSDGAIFEVNQLRQCIQPPLEPMCFLTLERDLWIGLDFHAQILVVDSETLQAKTIIHINSRGIRHLTLCANKVWVATREGPLYVIDADNFCILKKLSLHKDCVRSICTVDSHVVSGASINGKVAVWKAYNV